MYKLKTGISINYFDSIEVNDDYVFFINTEFEQRIKEMKDCGFDAIELDTFGLRRKKAEEEMYPQVKDAIKLIKEAGLHLNSVHLPFGYEWHDISSPNENIRKSAVENFVKLCSCFDGNLPDYFVMHPGLRPSEDDRKVRIEQLIKSLNELTDSIKAGVCIENMTNQSLLYDSDEALYVLDKAPRVNMVIDTNHMLFETPQHYIRKIGNKIKTLHISDRDFERERHYMTGYGVLNWKEIISALEDVKYNGVFMFEIYFKCELYDHTVAEIKSLCDDLFEKYNDKK